MTRFIFAVIMLMAASTLPATANELQSACSKNYPNATFSPITAAAVVGDNIHFTVQGKNFVAPLPDPMSDEYDSFALGLAAGFQPPNLLLGSLGGKLELYGPFQSGTAGQYASEEDEQAWACMPLGSAK